MVRSGYLMLLILSCGTVSVPPVPDGSNANGGGEVKDTIIEETESEKYCEFDDDCPKIENDKCIMSVCDKTSHTCKFQSLDCDDKNPCTLDKCESQKGCVHEFDPSGGIACGDGDPCTDDFCDEIEKVCIHKPILDCKGCYLDDQCDDGNPCTDNRCQDNKCISKPMDGVPCDDKDICTTKSICKNENCTPVEWEQCDDGIACTIDVCDNGCIHKDICVQPNPICTKDGCVCGEAPDSPTKQNPIKCGQNSDMCVNSICKCGKMPACNQPNPICYEGQCGCVKKGAVNPISIPIPSCNPKLADKCDVETGQCKCGAGLQCPEGKCCTNGKCGDICLKPNPN